MPYARYDISHKWPSRLDGSSKMEVWDAPDNLLLVTWNGYGTLWTKNTAAAGGSEQREHDGWAGGGWLFKKCAGFP